MKELPKDKIDFSVDIPKLKRKIVIHFSDRVKKHLKKYHNIDPEKEEKRLSRDATKLLTREQCNNLIKAIRRETGGKQ